FEAAHARGLDFFSVTDHLEQLTAETWARSLRAAQHAQSPGSFVALSGYEWGGYPTFSGWMNHVNVVGSDRMLSVVRTLGLHSLYRSLLRLPGPTVVAQFNHPGMLKAAIGRNNWNGFEYHGDGDLCVKLIMVETRSPTEENNREEVGYIPALDHGWHLAPKAEEDNHHADWARTRERTGVWLDRLELSA